MICVDTNVIAYLLIEGDHSAKSAALLQADSMWAAPILWRSEFRNVLVHYIRANYLSLAEAQQVMAESEELMSGNEFEVGSREVLQIASGSGCSAYDCEFVVLAQRLALPLYTSDKKVLAAFPGVAMDLKVYGIQS